MRKVRKDRLLTRAAQKIPRVTVDSARYIDAARYRAATVRERSIPGAIIRNPFSTQAVNSSE